MRVDVNIKLLQMRQVWFGVMSNLPGDNDENHEKS
jgi:hypothetical protein